jgi:hypothetical protein
MTAEPARDVLIEGTWNARVFGGRHPWLMRSATLDSLTDRGREALARLGVERVIDLRERAERGIPGHRIECVHVPVFAGTRDTGPFVTMEISYRMVLESSGDQLVRAVIQIAEADGVAAVHCALGKDRTGLVVALALLAAGYPRDVIVEDYALSGRRQPTYLRRWTLERMAWAGVEAPTPAGREYLRSSLDSPPDVLSGALDFLEVNGGWRGYLAAHGLTEAHADALGAKAGMSMVEVVDLAVPRRVVVAA